MAGAFDDRGDAFVVERNLDVHEVLRGRSRNGANALEPLTIKRALVSERFFIILFGIPLSIISINSIIKMISHFNFKILRILFKLNVNFRLD